jgi:hypothetical protein
MFAIARHPYRPGTSPPMLALNPSALLYVKSSVKKNRENGRE